MAAITLDIGGNTRQLDRDIQKTVNKVYSINLKTKGDQPLGRITGKVNEFTKSLDASNARVIAFGASAGIIFGVERAFTALVSATIEVQKSLQDINVILNTSQANLQKFGAELFSIARNTGQSFQEVAKAATEFSRQGLGIEETLKRTNEALILSRLSGLDAAKSVESLTAAVNSFASQAVTATEVVNKFATVDAAFAVSSADLADAIARVGSSAAQSGVSLNELIAIVTSAQQTTARGGAVIGNSFKTIFTRLQREKVVDLLESLGISGTDASGQVKSTIQLLQDLGKVYDTLGAQQQAYVAEQVGGVFQINILKAALADLGKEYSIYSSALNVAAGATDQAIRRNEELNKTYSAQINALAENARQLAAAGGERLLGPSIDRLVGGTNTLLKGFTESDGQGVGAVLGKGILDGIGQFIAGPGLALIGGVLLKLFRDLAKFATGSVQQLLGLNTAATQQRDLQQSINQILSKNPQLLQLALQGEQGLNAAANSLLASLQKQTVELQRQAAVAAQISKAFVAQAGVRVAGGVPVVPTGKPGKAAGYIPNFASKDFAREELLAKTLGAKNPKAQTSKGTIDGKKFIKNNEEIEITNFGRNGDSAVIPTYAKGFIPNFQKAPQTPKEIVVTGAKKYGYLIPSTAPGRLSTPDKPIPGGTVTDTSNNIKYVFPPQTAYGPKLVEEAEDSNKLENQIYQSVLNRTASFTKRLAPPGKPVSPDDLEKGFQSAKGARGAILSAIGAAFEVGITTALGYEAASSNTGAGDFDVRAGKGIEKIQSLFGIGGIVKADFKATTGGDSVTSFRKKILREEFGFGGAKKRTGPTGKELKERGLTSGFRRKAFAGYIPNFAAIQDAVARERAAGIPSSKIYVAQNRRLAAAGYNPLGLGVFNTRDEPTAGARSAAIKSRGYASGYIPNFAIEDPDVQAVSTASAFGALATQASALAFAFQFTKEDYKNALQEFENENKKAAKGAEKFGLALQSNALALSIAAPILGETVKNILGQETKGARVGGAAASAVGQIGSFAATGAMVAGPGPQALAGAGIGAALGALLTVPDVIKNALTDFPELAKEAQKAQQKLTQFGDASSRLIQAYESYRTVLESGNASAEQLSKVQKSLAEALLSVPAEYRQELTDAVGTGNVAEAAARIQEINAQEVIVKAGVATLEQVTGEAAYQDFGNTVIDAFGYLDFTGINKAADALSQFTTGKGIGELLLGTSQETLAGEANVENIQKIFEQALIGGDFSTQNLEALQNIKIDTSSIENLKKSLENITTVDKEGNAKPKFTEKQISSIIEQAEINLTTTGENISKAFNGTVTNLEDVIEKNTEAEIRLKAYNAAMDESKKRIDATVSSLKTNLEVQNLLKKAFDTTSETLRSIAADINIARQFTQPAESLGQVIGTDKTPTRKLQAQSDVAVIQEQERSAISGFGIEFKDTIRGILKEPFAESAAKLLENLKPENLKGEPDKVKTQTDKIIAQTTTEYQKLNSVMGNVEGYMAQFVNGQISTQQLLEASKSELANVGIDVSRGSQASDAIEKAVAELEVKSIQEQVKAFQQRAKLANETKQAILQSKIDEATKVFGGFQGFLDRPEEEQNYIQKIKGDLDKISEIRSGVEFRYGNKESIEARKEKAPDLGRAFAGVYGELIDQSGGAFREFIQAGLKERQLTGGMGGAVGKLGGYDDIIAGRQEDIEQQLKLAEDELKVTTDPVLKRDLQGFIDSIRNMPGGTKGIATLQTQKELGVARQSDFAQLYGKYENEALNRLKDISPELAASLESAISLSDDPLVAEAQTQSLLQSEMVGYLGPIQDAILQIANLGTGTEAQTGTGAKQIEAYKPKLTEEQQKKADEFRKKQEEVLKKEADIKAKKAQEAAMPKPDGIYNNETGFRTFSQINQEQNLAGTQAILGPNLGLGSASYVNGVKQNPEELMGVYEETSIDKQRKALSSITLLEDIQERNFAPGRKLSEIGSDVSIASYDMGVKRQGLYEGDMGREVEKRRLQNNPLLTLTPQNITTRGATPISPVNQQSFTQQEAAFNNNTSAITSLTAGIENLAATVSTLQETPQAAAANINTQPQNAPAITTNTNAPISVTVNAQGGGGDIATAVGQAVQNSIPEIIEKVRIAMGEKVPPTASKPLTTNPKFGAGQRADGGFQL